MPDHAASVLAWRDALRAGDTTPWMTAPRVSGAPVPGALPSAAQLEFARRLLLAPPVGETQESLAGLVDLVLDTPLAGRGPTDQLPLWPDGDGRFGGPTVDPAELPIDELLRVAQGVLALLVTSRIGPGPRTQEAKRRWRAPRFVVHGPPASRRQVAQLLASAGWLEGGRRAVQLVLAGPLDESMLQVWEERLGAGGSVPWRRLWLRSQRRGSVPAALDAAALAGELARQHPGQVRVILGADPPALTRAVRQALRVSASVETVPLDADALDVVRRVNPILGTLVTGGARTDAARRLIDLTRGAGGHGRSQLGAPRALRHWAGAEGARIASALAQATTYAVHGDPSIVVPRSTVALDSQRSLEVALQACWRGWREVGDSVGHGFGHGVGHGEVQT